MKRHLFAVSLTTTDTVFQVCHSFPYLLRDPALAILPKGCKSSPICWVFTANEYLGCREISIHYASSIKAQPLSPLRTTLLANRSVNIFSAMPLQIFKVIFCCRQCGLEKKNLKKLIRTKHFQFTSVKFKMPRKVVF